MGLPRTLRLRLARCLSAGAIATAWAVPLLPIPISLPVRANLTGRNPAHCEIVIVVSVSCQNASSIVGLSRKARPTERWCRQPERREVIFRNMDREERRSQGGPGVTAFADHDAQAVCRHQGRVETRNTGSIVKPDFDSS